MAGIVAGLVVSTERGARRDRRFGRFVSGLKIPFPGTGSGRWGSTGGLQRGLSKHLALARPFGQEIAEAGHSHSVGESPIDRCLDEVGREEGERDRHVHLAHAAALTSARRNYKPRPPLRGGRCRFGL